METPDDSVFPQRTCNMKYRFISDSHTHSECSFDGNDSVIMMCEQASGTGLYSITITDHCECHEYYANNVRSDIERSLRDISRARAMYSDRLRVYTGIELGQPTQDVKAAQEALSLGNYDFVLGSLHNLRGEQDFYFLEYTKDNADALLRRYFTEMLELAQQDMFDSLAHLDYPLRYITGNSGISVRCKDYQEMIDEILKTLVRNEKAMEVNTSGIRQVIGRTLPGIEMIQRFRELGGKYITLGSDAHRWGDIGSGIEYGLELLSRCGYTHFTVYDRREPHLLPIT